jgi:hypothetical protein
MPAQKLRPPRYPDPPSRLDNFTEITILPIHRVDEQIRADPIEGHTQGVTRYVETQGDVMRTHQWNAQIPLVKEQ